MQDQQANTTKRLTEEEIKEAVTNARKTGMRYTVDHYLLDYIKHCFLEDDQLNQNIERLQASLNHISDPAVQNGVKEVIKSLECVKTEYAEYQEDMALLAAGDYPKARGVVVD